MTFERDITGAIEFRKPLTYQQTTLPALCVSSVDALRRPSRPGADRPEGGAEMEACRAPRWRTAVMGGVGCGGGKFITLRNPFTLQHWTLPLIEVTLGPRSGCLPGTCPTVATHPGQFLNLVIWFAGIFCLLLIEPIAYFPQWFSVEKAMGLAFVHNQFSVQFLYDRLRAFHRRYVPVLRLRGMGSGAAQRNASALQRVRRRILCVALHLSGAVRGDRHGRAAVPLVGVESRGAEFHADAVPRPLISISRPSRSHCLSPWRWSPCWCANRARSAGSSWSAMWCWCACWSGRCCSLSSLPSLLLTLAGVSVETARVVATWLLVSAIASSGFTVEFLAVARRDTTTLHRCQGR